MATTTAYAQETPYKFSAGIAAGMSGYLGDASTNLLKHPGFTASGGLPINMTAAGTSAVVWAYRL